MSFGLVYTMTMPKHGMCGYKFNQFFREKDIENDNDLLIQEKFLSKINELIDLGILSQE